MIVKYLNEAAALSIGARQNISHNFCNQYIQCWECYYSSSGYSSLVFTSSHPISWLGLKNISKIGFQHISKKNSQSISIFFFIIIFFLFNDEEKISKNISKNIFKYIYLLSDLIYAVTNSPKDFFCHLYSNLFLYS